MKKTQQIELFSINRNREYIFVETIKELRNRLKRIDREPYNLVRISSILRLLFVDGSKYYSVINLNYRLKLGSKLLCSHNHSGGLSTMFGERDQISYLKFGVKDKGDFFKISDFLNTKVIEIDIPTLLENSQSKHIKSEYNVRELIKVFANAHGGVHLENWSKDFHNFISVHPTSPVNINANSDFYSIIKNISAILLSMIEPLEEQVILNLQKTDPIGFQSVFENNFVSIVFHLIREFFPFIIMI